MTERPSRFAADAVQVKALFVDIGEALQKHFGSVPPDVVLIVGNEEGGRMFSVVHPPSGESTHGWQRYLLEKTLAQHDKHHPQPG
jgi:hypothetical protein